MPPGLKRQLIRSSIVFIMALALFAVAAVMLNNDLTKKSAEVADARLATKQNVELQNTLANLKETVPKIDDYQAKLEALLPKRDQLIDVPRYIDAQAKINQVTIKFNFGDEQPVGSASVPGLGKMGYSMSISGTMDNIVKFLAVIEKNSPKYWMSVDSIKLNKTAEAFGVQTDGAIYFQ